jgi:SPP1 gp7 family putative phage head morphogenesis protein
MADGKSAGARFVEAIDYLRRRLRLNVSDADWQAMVAGAESAADAVIDTQKDAMVRDMIEAVLDAIEQGTTVDAFQDDYERIVKDHGWTVKGEPGWHSRLIFRLHTNTAYSVGRWEQSQRQIAARPGTQFYFRYVTAGDNRVRDNHSAWHGVILPVEHGFWRTHWTPNGFNCRCYVQLVTERDIARFGWVVTAGDDARLAIAPDDGWSGNVGVAAAVSGEVSWSYFSASSQTKRKPD